jgi:hypothetical protein
MFVFETFTERILIFCQGDAAKVEPLPKTYDIVSCIGASWIGGGMRGTLELIRQKGLKGRSESLALLGDVFWKDTPLGDAIQAMCTKRGE